MKSKDYEFITIAVLQIDYYDGSIYLGNADYIGHYHVSTVVIIIIYILILSIL